MNIIYKKNTLYVYLEEGDQNFSNSYIEKKIERIIKLYEIENLVIDAGAFPEDKLDAFKTNYNTKHRVKMRVR